MAKKGKSKKEMNGLIKDLREHLKTKKKYNTLDIKYKAKCEESDDKTIQLNVERRIKKKQQELFNEKIKELTNKIIDLTEEKAILKKEIRERKKEIAELKKTK